MLASCCLAALSLLAADDPVSKAQSPAAARLNGEPILATEVDRELRLANASEEGSDEQRAKLRRAALDQVIDRRLILAFLAKSNEAASAQDVDFALSQFKKELTAQNLTLEQHCQQVGLSLDEVRRALAWKVTWKRYCEKHLTPQNLEKYFERYRREFDGTQLRLAQILFKRSPAAADRAARLRQEIVAGKIAFAAAAQRDSEAPSREAGGDIGWIERRRPMPEDFSRLAFTLKTGEVSEPLVSPFGVHLVTVLDEKPGSLTWRDVESELRPAVTLYLFRWLADKERASAKIEYAPPPR